MFPVIRLEESIRAKQYLLEGEIWLSPFLGRHPPALVKPFINIMLHNPSGTRLLIEDEVSLYHRKGEYLETISLLMVCVKC